MGTKLSYSVVKCLFSNCGDDELLLPTKMIVQRILNNPVWLREYIDDLISDTELCKDDDFMKDHVALYEKSIKELTAYLEENHK